MSQRAAAQSWGMVFHSPRSDLLASIPSMLGETPRESLVVVPIGPRGYTGLLCVPLPRWDDSLAIKRVAKSVTGTVTKDPSIDLALLAVFTGQVAGSAFDRPFERLQRVVYGKLHASGVHLAESFYVAANGWGSFLAEPGTGLAGPRDLGELRSRAAVLDDELADDPDELDGFGHDDYEDDEYRYDPDFDLEALDD